MHSYIKTLFLTIAVTWVGCAQVNMLTANGGKDRTNANLQETQLAPATVGPETFGQLGTYSVDGQVYTQPLYISGLAIPAVGLKNVVVIATMHNSVYAYDADSAAPNSLLWHVNLGPSVPAETLFGSYSDIQLEVGILGTGVIDLQHSVLYVVSDVFEHGAPVFYLHALDLINGRERLNGPVAIGGSVAFTGSSGSGAAGGTASNTVVFDAWRHLQRPGLLLANNTVSIAFGSHGDQPPYHGWVMSYDASDLTRQVGVFLSTPTGMGGSIWQSGRGLAADDRGSAYLITGNGDYDGIRNFGESFLKLSGTPLALVDSFTPNDWKSLSDNDMDLSAGPALVPGSHTVIGADKAGNLYALNGDSMRQSGPATKIAASAFSIFNFAVWGRPDKTYVYVQGETEPARCFQLTSAGFDSSPVSVSAGAVRLGRIGMTISANGAHGDTGILWETTGDYSDSSAPGTLHAFNAANLGEELWNSDMNPGRDAMGAVAKFANPTVANGKVYVPSFSNAVYVYGLLVSGVVPSPAIDSVTNAASYAQAPLSPGELLAIFGSNLGPATPAGTQLDASGLVGTNLAGTRVLFDGVPGPMAYTSSGQVNVIVPFGVSPTSTGIQVEFQGRLSDSFSSAIAPSSPGVFAADGSGSGQGLIFNQDGSANSAANPASAGSVIVLYATGAGQLSPPGQDGLVVTADSLPGALLPVSATIGGQPARVLYAGGAFGIVEGIIQVNLQIPDGAQAGAALVALQIGGRTSQPNLTVALQPAATAGR